MVKNGSPDHAPADNNNAVVRFHLPPCLAELWSTRVTESFGAGLGNGLKEARSRPHFVRKCGFCRLVGWGRICVCMAIGVDCNAGIRAPGSRRFYGRRE